MRSGWRWRLGEGGELELNYILISRPFRSAHRDMPNIRRNLHFKLDTSCRDSEGLVGDWHRLARLLSFRQKAPRIHPASPEIFQKLKHTRRGARVHSA